MTSNPTISILGPNQLPEPHAPFLALRDMLLFPHCLASIAVEAGSGALEQSMRQKRLLALFPALPINVDPQMFAEYFEKTAWTHKEELFVRVGILVRIIKRLENPDGSSRILVRGIRRIQYDNLVFSGGVPEILFTPIPEDPQQSEEGNILHKSIVQSFQNLLTVQPNIPDELRAAVLNTASPERLTDLLADALPIDHIECLLLLQTLDVKERMRRLMVLINREVEVSRLGIKIQSEVNEAMGQMQRETYLREQLRAIQHELGEENQNPDIAELERRIYTTDLPPAAEEVVRKEFSRLEILPPPSPEYHIAYTYINWLLDVPWNVFTEDTLDVKTAEKILDADHYGLKDVKERILEFLAVLQLKKDRKAPILCLVGPPGVGKTSLGQSIARAMNRNFIRVALGGVRDEAEIRGHRRTYVGALPGRIIQNLKKAGSSNPILMLDEIDKLASDVRGDPASALLEVLDPAQNHTFKDNYLEVGFDLSNVFFITTANLLETIPPPLRDRMEIIRLPGYTSFEKREIAKRYLVPRQIKENGLKKRQIRITLGAIDEMIDRYSREAGVRELERVIAQICRKIARRIVEEKISPDDCTSISAKTVRELLGPPRYVQEVAEESSEPGNAVGLAWTSCGGAILPIEVLSMPGKGNLKLTGSLGKVIQESAEAAFSFLRSKAEMYNIAPEVFTTRDFHLHMPDGATPKDGPSAGGALTTALLSLLTGRRVRPLLAMTGEITLQGKITIVGGIREKVIAALRAGIRTVLLPEENRKDTEEIAPEILSQLKIVFVRRFEEVAALALLEPDAEKGEKQ